MSIFVAGLSKSGKTTRAHHAATVRGDLDYVGVSKLLKDKGGILPVHTINDALLNQHKAAEGLQALPRQKPYQLIDGHALIETAEGPFIVPHVLFDEIRPSLIIYFEENPQDLYQRRLLLGMKQIPAELVTLAAIERSACERIASRHGIPLVVLQSPTTEAFRSSLDRKLDELSERQSAEDR